jgi:hypothetical protein
LGRRVLTREMNREIPQAIDPDLLYQEPAKSAIEAEAVASTMKWMRATTELSFLDFVDLLSRGGTAEWQELYAEAKQNSSVRAMTEKALAFIDPETGDTQILWRYLLGNMRAVDPAESVHVSSSEIRERLRRIAGS